MDPLSPRAKWRAILLATLLLVPAFWAIMVGLVALQVRDPQAPDPGLFIALGLCLIPFVFIVLSFSSGHPRAPTAVLKAMALTVLVGIPAGAADPVTGLVAGIGSGGIAALRSDRPHPVKVRAPALFAACLYTFVLVRVAGPAALLTGPILPFTAIGVADHVAERRAERAASPTDSSSDDAYDG